MHYSYYMRQCDMIYYDILDALFYYMRQCDMIYYDILDALLVLYETM